MKQLITIFLLFASYNLWAQTPTLQATVSRNNVQVGGNFTISYRFNYSGDDFTPPGNITKDFRILSGPNKNSQMSYVNGQMSSSISYSYVLSPLNPGDYVLEPARIHFENKIYRSQAIKIHVVGATTQQNANTQNNNRQAKQIKNLANDIYLKLEVNKRTAYQGEQIVATYKLYNKAQLRGIEAERMPEFEGFYTSEVEISNKNNRTREIINGIAFDVYDIKKTILIPQKSGELTLIPMEIDAIVQIQGDKPVNTWFGPRYQLVDKKVLLKSNPIKLKIKPLPSGAPKDFTGAVGVFKFETSLSPEQVKVNDAVTYKVKISGVGNLPLINGPEHDWPQEFEVYDPKLKSNFNSKTGTIRGSKIWEYLAIPRNGGTYEFQPVSFSFFNLTTKKYQTITSSATTITVTGSATNNAGGTFSANANRQDLSRVGTDIRFIQTRNPQLHVTGALFFGSIWFYFWLIIPILLTILAFLVLRKQNELQSDTIGLKKRKATKFARQLLKQAEKTLASNDKQAFYESVFKAINGYVGNKLNITNAELNKSIIREKLALHQVTTETIESFINTLDHCEMARFAPVTSISDAELLSQAQALIVKLENEIK